MSQFECKRSLSCVAGSYRHNQDNGMKYSNTPCVTPQLLTLVNVRRWKVVQQIL